MNTFLKVGIGAAGLLAYSIWDGRKRSVQMQNARLAKGKRFVVVGGGFGGVEAALELTRLIPTAGEQCEVTLVDQNDFLLFTPMLTEAVGAQVQPHHVIVPLESFSGRPRLIKAQVTSIDLATREVYLDSPDGQPIVADQLVLALGANSDFHAIPGAEESAFTLKTLQDARDIRQNALAMVKAAAAAVQGPERDAMLTFLVAGGGYTGVEAIAALNEMIQEAIQLEPRLHGATVRMILAEPMDRLMSEVTPDLAAYAKEQLEQAGVRVLLKTGIKSAHGDFVELTNGEHIRTKTFIWTAGVKANALMEQLSVPKSKVNAVKVDNTLALPDYPGVWAIGDCAQVPKPGGEGSYAPTAQNATRQGKLVARNIVSSLRGDRTLPFTYTPIGELALVGRRRGIARIYGYNFSGFIAFAMWRAVYLSKMPSLSQRLRILKDWLSDAVSGPNTEINSQFSGNDSGAPEKALGVKA